MYRQQSHNPGSNAEQEYHLSASASSNYSQSPFSATMARILETNFQSPQHLSPAARTTLPGHPNQSAPSSDAQTMMGPPRSSTSPRMRAEAPMRMTPSLAMPQDRSLPSRGVSEDNIAEAYTAFILYCNPNFPLDVDTSTLKTNFQSPPKSDSKDFETYKLYELIKKFDAKEIKTWAQLAIDLGVEPPDVSKGQSVQKVQQYSVRLKRWMRAMHVDAFFEYLLGKQHAYFTDIPTAKEPYPANGRDGVFAEEDLAIRALDPSFRPKRGRRRNSELEVAEVDDNDGLQHTSNMQPHSAYADGSDDPWAIASAVTPRTFTPWAQKTNAPLSAVASAAPSHLRWQLRDSSGSIATPHPKSAHPTSMAAHIEAAFEDEPKSAITPSRKRRKHGPAVSSAWTSSNPSGTKPRGRPPANRNIQDGPYSTFPADPSNDRSNTPMSTLATSTETDLVAENTQALTQSIPKAQRSSEIPARPGRLSLQVPQHTGGPVRLATPPRVLINGETNDIEQATRQTQSSGHKMPLPVSRDFEQIEVPVGLPGFAFEVMKRVLTSDLLRAQLVGRPHRLTTEEAKSLADAVLSRLNVPIEDTRNPRNDIARLTAASWLGMGDQLNVPPGPAVSSGKRIGVTRFRVDAQGYEELASAYDTDSHGIREVFDLSWSVVMGGCSGAFELKGLTLGDPGPRPKDSHEFILQAFTETAKNMGVSDEVVQDLRGTFEQRRVAGMRPLTDDDGSVDWKAKYQAMEFGMQMAKGEMFRLRDRMVEKVLDILMDV